MSDGELIEYTKRFIYENGVRTIFELDVKNRALYTILGRRGLRQAIALEIEGRKKDEVLDQLREAVGMYTGKE